MTPVTPELWDRLRPFRDEAIGRGIPVDDVERWMGTARPCAALTRDGDGPVVGQFGGPLLLPAEVQDPAHPFVASIDLAALPADTTGLSLPPDGQLLLFAYPEIFDDYESMGSVVYVPVGTAVTERDRLAWNSSDWDEETAMFESFPQGPLRVAADVSLPQHHEVEFIGEPGSDHPHAEELVDVWESTQKAIAPLAPLQIGGYPCDEVADSDPVANAVFRVVGAAEAGHWDGPVSADVRDWVLLADWQAGRDVDGWESASVHWVIQREDLAARRFDRVYTSVFWNP